MGIFKIISHKDNFFTIGIWKIEESADFLKSKLELSNEENIELSSKKSELKYKQWLATRVLLSFLLNKSPKIVYSLSGKPEITDADFNNVSISHKNEWVAIIISQSNCGIDLESITEKASKVRHKFLHKDELNIRADATNDSLIWSVKEACYKLFGNDKLSFSNDICIKEFELNSLSKLNVEIKSNSQKNIFTVNYEKILNYYLAYVVELT